MKTKEKIMKTLNEALVQNRDKDYIVFIAKTKKVLYAGPDKQKAYRVSTPLTKMVEPLVKHTISAKQINEYLQRPSLYSF